MCDTPGLVDIIGPVSKSGQVFVSGPKIPGRGLVGGS
nr:MAG TPA: hypothetical protein [Caudoviricetes sp.]